MADSPVYGSTLITSLRRILKDTAWSYPQLEFLVSGGSSATVEITDGHFIVVNSGGVPVDYLLTTSLYETIELLAGVLNNNAGHVATLVDNGNPNHASTDLAIIGPTNCFNTTVILKTRRWSDAELSEALERALARHTLSVEPDSFYGWQPPYTIDTVPTTHHYLILLLAQIEVLKLQLQDAQQRRGIDLQPEQFVTLKQALEDEYRTTLELMLKRRPVLTEETAQDLGTGDFLMGQYFRRRAGETISPSVHSAYPLATSMEITALGSGKAQIKWKASTESNFSRYEIWRGTVPDITLDHLYVKPAGSLTANCTLMLTEYDRNAVNWIDGYTTAITPGTYWYRIYTYNRHNQFTGCDPHSVVVT